MLKKRIKINLFDCGNYSYFLACVEDCCEAISLVFWFDVASALNPVIIHVYYRIIVCFKVWRMEVL